MTGEEFMAWMATRSLNDSSAARALGISRPSIIKYKAEGAPLLVALACGAISAGVPPWSATSAIGGTPIAPGDIRMSGFRRSGGGGSGGQGEPGR